MTNLGHPKRWTTKTYQALGATTWSHAWMWKSLVEAAAKGPVATLRASLIATWKTLRWRESYALGLKYSRTSNGTNPTSAGSWAGASLCSRKRSNTLISIHPLIALYRVQGWVIWAPMTSSRTTKRPRKKYRRGRCSPRWMALWHLIIQRIPTRIQSRESKTNRSK
jgi:hypothetical protein